MTAPRRSLSAQIAAVHREIAASGAARGMRASEAEEHRTILKAALGTLVWMQTHEAAIRAWVAANAGDGEAS